MIKRFFFPHWTRSVKQFVDPMSSSALETLQNIHEWKRPAIGIAQRFEQEMSVIRHDHDRMQMNSRQKFGAGGLGLERQNATFP